MDEKPTLPPETTVEDNRVLTPANEDAVRSRYEILEEVGRGGMGVVYRARHRRLNRLVAIKVCLPGARTERFQREAQLLARINSAHIVTVHDFDQLEDGRPLLVMDWVEGSNLEKILRGHRGPVPEDRALLWMRQVAEGMLVAAKQGIVHRDLKPSNILIDIQDQARIADFGLARSTQVEPLSHTGCVMGTAHYMAPEQAEDPSGVDTRADIYSFGATFYHVLTGRTPFEGRTSFTILYKHKTEPLVSPRAVHSTLSERSSELLERCLAKSPADRFVSFAEILELLRPFSGTVSPWMVSDDERVAEYLERYQARRDAYLGETKAWNQELDVYTFPDGKVLRIIRGDLVEQPVDAVVSSETCYLVMDDGVSLALANAAGPEVVTEARRLGPARAGRAVVTSAGKLPARFIFHGVTVGYIGERVIRPSRDLIMEIMSSCFYHADTHSIKSIAFPLLGTGAQHFPRDICLDTMIQFLVRMLLRGLTTVRDTRIVLYRE